MDKAFQNPLGFRLGKIFLAKILCSIAYKKKNSDILPHK